MIAAVPALKMKTAMVAKDGGQGALLLARRTIFQAIDDLVARLGETVDDRSLTLLRDAAIQLSNRESTEETP